MTEPGLNTKVLPTDEELFQLMGQPCALPDSFRQAILCNAFIMANLDLDPQIVANDNRFQFTRSIDREDLICPRCHYSYHGQLAEFRTFWLCFQPEPNPIQLCCDHCYATHHNPPSSDWIPITNLRPCQECHNLATIGIKDPSSPQTQSRYCDKHYQEAPPSYNHHVYSLPFDGETKAQSWLGFLTFETNGHRGHGLVNSSPQSPLWGCIALYIPKLDMIGFYLDLPEAIMALEVISRPH